MVPYRFSKYICMAAAYKVDTTYIILRRRVKTVSVKMRVPENMSQEELDQLKESFFRSIKS